MTVTFAEALREHRYKALEGTAMASDMLKRIGFELACASLTTDSCYYRLPGRWGTVRVATHSRKKERRSGGIADSMNHKFGPVIARITFDEATHHNGWKLTEAYIKNNVAHAIGWFLIHAPSEETQR